MKKELSIIAVALAIVGTGWCTTLAQRVIGTVPDRRVVTPSPAAPYDWQNGTILGDAFSGQDSCQMADCAECDGAGCGCCRPPRWAHRTRLFGEFLYLRARDNEVPYAVQVDGPVTPPGNPSNPGNQVGHVALLDPDYQPAFRVGFERAWDECAGIRATYARYESSTSNRISAEPGDFIQSLVTHPGVLNAEDNWLDASATLDVDFKLIDVDYRWLYAHCDNYAVNLLGGVRYGQFKQDFHAAYEVNGFRYVDTRVSFDGGGIRLGLEAERFAPCSGWMVYGRGVASFLAGDFRASYFQGSNAAETEIETSWKAGRVVPILDLEIGVGWSGPCDRLRVRAGYVMSAWFNTLQTDEWIDAVNANRFSDSGSSAMVFDGLTAQAEFRF